MRDDRRSVSIDPRTRAADTPPKAAAIRWPRAVDRRLDQLVERANNVGARTSRSELAAAIVAAAEVDPEELLGAVLHWRTAIVREVIVDVPAGDEALYLVSYGPGRRRGGPP